MAGHNRTRAISGGSASPFLRSGARSSLLDGHLAKAEPKTLRYRLLHTAGRLTFTARTAILHLPANWPWIKELTAAFTRLAALPIPAG